MTNGDPVQPELAAADTAAEPSPFPRRLRDLALVMASLAAVVGACWLLYYFEASRIAVRQAERESVRVTLLARLLESELRPVANNLRLLADGDGLRSFLETGSEAGLAAAVRRARFVSQSYPDFSEVRYLDETGREVIRVNRGGEVVAGHQLQDKSDRPFFQRANALPPGGLYLSEFDLMMDFGKVIMPPRPVLRFAMPVFDTSGRRRGIYVINYLGENLVAHLQEALSTAGHRLRLLSDEGHWLKAADPSMEWGSMYPERVGLSLPRTQPALWERIRTQAAGVARGDGMFTWQHVRPEDFTGQAQDLVTEEAFLVVASEIPSAEWAALFTGVQRILLIAATVLGLLVLLSAWLIGARRRVLGELRTVNQQLEERVQARTAELAHSYQQVAHREDLLEETGLLAKVGGWEFDPATGEGSWTPEIARIHDIAATINPTKELGLQFYPGESRQRLEQALAKSLADGTPYDLELEFISARGEPKWVRTISRPVVENGKVVRMRGALQDVTQHKRAELRLHTQLQRLQLLERTTRAIGERQDLSSILQVVIRTLEEQLPLDFGCICHYDASDRSLTVAAVGIGSRELAGQLSMPERARIPIDENGLSRCVRGELVYEPDIADVPFPFPRRLAAGGLRALVVAPLQIESKVFGVLVAARTKPESFSSGECEFIRQMSEHVALAAHQAQLIEALQKAYEDLHTTQQTVLQQERLRVLGQMASGIAHDINNAISPIMLYTESLLEREPGLSNSARQNLLTIQQAVSDVAETVARMREFYRQREAQNLLMPVQINALIVQLRELTRARWATIPQQHGVVIDLRLELAEGLPAVQGIESEIREALTNLVFNGVDAMPTGGTLTIRTRRGEDGKVWVEVADTGAGMDEETRLRCLEPFFTTKGERGTGLGLPMVYGVMQRHGGDVSIDSAPGRGTTVRLSFIVTEKIAKPPSEVLLEPPAGLHLLLVDDDPILINSLRETLQLDGHHITTAHGGQDGIDAFRTSMQPGAQRFSLVITDLGMPHVDGRSVAAAIKQASPATPVVLLTGWGERLLAEGNTPANVDRVLSKPPRLRDLRRTLAELLAPRPSIG